ncbi:uncharacterized protein HMPREF1541_10632 [Cyphellophora europaea CBS 101466]|uniref:Uncharacterized protein n=1 Tax=Cyphellophora europaea (strain CBS 101466) TaxID=1220924 RepID=W2S6X1_CYPE1|nr:uncharacterized protein HMPREF1541_10632 [Cyphellophora europaea CBS 101466]ETN44451.1 hypothetical protein HMPREF1541_10632 [Cyphellophora europaea CBS 101466]
MAASMSGHLSLQFLWVLKALFTLLESTLVKIELLYALIFKILVDTCFVLVAQLVVMAGVITIGWALFVAAYHITNNIVVF